MGNCTYDTVLSRKIVMAIKLQALVSMGWFAVHFYAKGVVCLRFDQGIKIRDSPILLITFNSELYSWIYTVYMIQKKLLLGLLFEDPSVINKPVPKPWGKGRPECFSKCSIYRFATIQLTGDPIATPSACS